AAVSAAGAWAPGTTRLAQQCHVLPAQLSARHSVDRRVDGLVGHVPSRLEWMLLVQSARDLFRGEAGREQCAHAWPQQAVRMQLAFGPGPAPQASGPCPCTRSVVTSGDAGTPSCSMLSRRLVAIATQLTGDRALGTLQHASNLATTAPLLQQRHDRAALFGAQMRVMASHPGLRSGDALELRDHPAKATAKAKATATATATATARARSESTATTR